MGGTGPAPMAIGAGSTLDFVRMGPAPTFKGEDAKYAIWAQKLGFYFRGRFPEIRRILAWVEACPEDFETDELALNFPQVPVATILEMDSELYTVLGKCCEDDASTLVLNTVSESGFEAWRRLAKKHDVRTAGRTRNMLHELMKTQPVKAKDLLSAIEALEHRLSVYERRKGQPLDDEMRQATLISLCPADIQKHINLNSSGFTTYGAIKKLAVSYAENITGASATPMDVSGLTPKGKGKGKDGDKSGSCHHCGLPGHWANECPKKVKGGGKTGGKGKAAAAAADPNRRCKHCAGTTREWSHWTSECKSNPFGKGKGKENGKGKPRAIAAVEEATEATAAEIAASHVKTWIEAQMAAAARGSGNAGGFQYLGNLNSSSSSAVPAIPLRSLERLPEAAPIFACRAEPLGCFVKLGLDSCAGDSVCPLGFAPSYAAGAASGKRYRVADGTIIEDAGSIEAQAVTRSGQQLSLDLTRCAVHKPLLSAGKQVRAGAIIHLELNNSWVHFPASGHSLKVEIEEDDTFSIEVQMLPNGRSFGRGDCSITAMAACIKEPASFRGLGLIP